MSWDGEFIKSGSIASGIFYIALNSVTKSWASLSTEFASTY